MKTVLGIHGVPRSGTSWLAQLFNASPSVSLKFQPLFSYAFKDYLKVDSSANEIQSFFEKIYKTDDLFVNMKDEQIHKNYPIFKKNKVARHLVFKHVRYHYLIENMLKLNPDVKFILVLRNPFAVLSSWKNAPREFNPDWDFESEWRDANKKNLFRESEYFGYTKWREASELFIKLKNIYPDRVSLLYYDKLLNNTLNEVVRLFDFAEITFTDEVAEFVNLSKSKTVAGHNSVYRKKNSMDDEWKKSIPLHVQAHIKNDLKGHFLENLI